MTLDALRLDFENYIQHLKNAQLYKDKLVHHFNDNTTWRHLRKLTVLEYMTKYGHLVGKSFYTQLKREGLDIYESDSGNRDAYSNVHSHLKKFFTLNQLI